MTDALLLAGAVISLGLLAAVARAWRRHRRVPRRPGFLEFPPYWP